MKFTFADEITYFLVDAINKNYKKGITDVVKKAKKFSGTGRAVTFAIEIDYSRLDEEAIRMFQREAFIVGRVGSYELQEKLKKLAEEVWRSGQDFDEFEKLSRSIMLDYIPLNDQLPSGWLETNYNTAVNSSYKAAEYNRLQQYKALYPAYEYRTQADDRVRPEHEDLDGKIFKADDPIWDTIWPPNDWNCRCYVDVIDADEYDENELTDADEEERSRLENTVAPDYRRNPGQDQSIWGNWLSGKLDDMPDDIKKEIEEQTRDYSKKL